MSPPTGHQGGGAPSPTPDPALPSDSDYSRHEGETTVWASVEAMAGADAWGPGIHVVMLPAGGHLDLLFIGDIEALPAGRALPVVFSGAVGSREGTRAPFFSGTGLGRGLGTALVAISDPLLAGHDGLKLGWYTGGVHEDIQRHLAEILRVLSERVERELLLVGGSGGGFAALHQALRLDVPVSALVWNPQTDLLDYDPAAVAEYLTAALGRPADEVAAMTRDERSRALATGGVEHRVLAGGPPSPSLRRLLYLQNASDWHVTKHLAPFLDEAGFTHTGGGRWSGPDGVMALVSAMAGGHSAPPRKVLEQSLGAMLDVSFPVSRVVDDLQAARVVPATELDLLPRDLRSEVDEVGAKVGLGATIDNGGTARAALVWDDWPNRYGGISTVFELLDHTGSVLAERAHADNAVQVPRMGERLTTVRAHLRDGFLNHILTLTQPVARTPVRLRVLVVGSCVSRDTFEFLQPDYFSLQGYVARQSLVSAFAPAGEPHFDLSVIASAFQRRMLEGDARSSLPEVVAEQSSEVDLILWDLVDERLGLLDHEDGTVSTDSVELRQARLDGHAPTGPTGPAFGSPEHLARFTAALPQWRQLLEDHGLLARTVLVAPPWAAVTETGDSTPSSFGLTAERANELIEGYLSAAEALGVPVVGRDLTSARSHTEHQWGPAPFHYDDATSLDLAQQVTQEARRLCTPWGWEALSSRELTRVPTPDQRDPRQRVTVPEASVEQTGSLELTVRIEGASGRACSFSLHQGGRRLDATPYVRTTSHRFTVREPGIYRCRIFILSEDGDRLPVNSPPLRIS